MLARQAKLTSGSDHCPKENPVEDNPGDNRGQYPQQEVSGESGPGPAVHRKVH
jgi:hypothetical protein